MMDTLASELALAAEPFSGIMGFDYERLDAAAANQAKAVVERYRGRVKAYVIDTGQDLLAVKARLEHGLFQEWVKSEMGLTPRTAQNFMQAATQLGHKSEIVSYLPPTVLYALAAPSISDLIRASLLERIEAGELVKADEILGDLREAKDAARKHAAQQKEVARRASLSQEARDEEDCIRGRGEKKRAALSRKRKREQIEFNEHQRQEDAVLAQGAAALLAMLGADRITTFFAQFGGLAENAFREAGKEAHRQRARAVEPTEISIDQIWRNGSLCGRLAPEDRPRINALAEMIERDGLTEFPIVVRANNDRIYPYHVLEGRDTIRALVDVLQWEAIPVRIAPSVVATSVREGDA